MSSSSSDSGSDNEDAVSRVLKRSKSYTNDEDAQPFTWLSTFDNYFTQSTTRSRTSSNVFSSLVLPLTQDEYAGAIHAYKSRVGTHRKLAQPTPDILARYTRELDEGFNLLFYGFGSKRCVLNDFAASYLSRKGHVVVVNGFTPGVGIKDVLTSIEDIISGLGNTSFGSGGGLEGQTQRVYDYFSSIEIGRDNPKAGVTKPLYLVIHNIDAPPLRSLKAHSTLSFLALNPHIHIVASVDRLNALLLWTSSEIAARKHEPYSSSSSSKGGRRGFAWLFHDLTTLASYDAELSWADRTSISGASSSNRPASSLHPDGVGGTKSIIDETAALHVLASVTQKAKKLFAMLGKRQVDWEDESAGSGPSASVPSSPTKSGSMPTSNMPSTPSHAATISGAPPTYALPYDQLFHLARDHFLATSDGALRALLGEFRDHSLVVSSATGEQSTEVMWIPMRRERLIRVLEALGDI